MHYKLGAIAVAALIAAGCGGTARPAVSRPLGQVRITGARPAEEQELRRLLAALGRNEITRVDLTRRAGSALTLPPGELAIVIASGLSDIGAWEAKLLGELYVDEVGRLHLRPIRIISTFGDLSRAGNTPAVVRGTGSLAELRAFLAKPGARVVELRRVARATALTVRATFPARFLRRDGVHLLELLRAAAGNEWYFGVQDAAGDVVYAGYSLAGQSGYDPGNLEGCGPLRPDSPPPGWRRPPCPS